MKRKTVTFLPGYYEYRIHLGIVRYARKANWILLRGLAEVTPDIDGIISFHANHKEIIDAVENSKVPVVDLSVKSEKMKVPCVIHDNKAIGRMGGEYLCNLGFKDIAYAQLSTHPNDYDRMLGLKEEVLKRNKSFHLLDYKTLKEELKQKFLNRNKQEPFALMCPNDRLAVGAMRVCEDLNLRIPHDVALLGVDDDILQCDLAPIPLSSVNTNFEAVGYKAAELLDKMLQGEQIPNTATLIPPVNVVARQSTNICAVPHLQTSQALLYLKENFNRKLNLESVALDSGMCRRRLEDAFKKHVGHSMRAELTRLRLEHAIKLLRGTDLKLMAVADESGFSSLEHMSRIFKREFNNSPANYRKSSLK